MTGSPPSQGWAESGSNRPGARDRPESLLRRQALTLLKNERTATVGLKIQCLTVALDEDYFTNSPNFCPEHDLTCNHTVRFRLN